MGFVNLGGFWSRSARAGIYTQHVLRNTPQSSCFKLGITPQNFFHNDKSHLNARRGSGPAISSSLLYGLGPPHSTTNFGRPSGTFTTPYGLRNNGAVNVLTHMRYHSTDQSDSSASSTTTQETPPSGDLRTHIENFFANYPGFEYDPTKPCMDEFKRLKKWKGWSKKSVEFEQARNGMNEALTDQFNAIYGKDPEDVVAWRNLCSTLNLAEIPTQISACKKLIKSLYINIVDLVDQPVTDVRVGYFRTEQELARYTRQTKKFYSLPAAKQGALLKCLLCFIEQPRRKRRSNPKLRKTQTSSK